MCGILGLVNIDGARFEDDATLLQLLETLALRGPDGKGHECRDHVGFGHHRLAIRDLEQGQQPWLSPDGECVLVYNGELYNDDELRRSLRGSYSFRTQCDTEVIMAAYLKWGRACVTRLRGMFALGLYDFRDNKLWLVRDRFGIKPLYFARVGRQFVFASQIATIVAHPKFHKSPDWQTVSHYLSTTRLTLGARTVYEGLQQLEPAQELTLSEDRVELRRYWDYPQSRSQVTYDDAVDQLQEGLMEAVTCRMTSDVPVGLFLSGGVDSSTIASLVHQQHGSCYATCATTQLDGRNEAHESDDELNFALDCAREVETELEPVRLDQRHYKRRWLKLLAQHRTPLTTPSDVLIYEIARAAKQHVGVVLGGEGSDELLCGYEIPHWSGHDYDAAHALQSGGGNASMLKSIVKQYGRSRFASESDHYFALNSLLPTHQKHRILNPSIVDTIENDLVMYSHYQQLYDDCGDFPTVEKNAVLLHRTNLESLLARLDASTMATGLEARVPFTDHLLVEQMFQLPFHYRIDVAHQPASYSFASAELAAGGFLRPKRILRTVARRFLPSRLADRKKASFPTGVQQWFQRDWVGWVSQYLAKSPFASFFLADGFREELVRVPALAGMWLWPIMNLSLWGDIEFFGATMIPE